MEPARPPSARLAAVAAYGATVAVCAAVLCWGLNLHRRDLGVPLTYQGDSLQSIQYLKGTLENGWVLHNAQLGAPGALDMHDFPLTDSALFAIVRVLGWFTDDVFRVYNLFFLLGFPLAAVAAVAVMRHFGLSYPACVAGGVLYAFLPYHLIRGQGHLLLSAYFFVPLTAMAALWVCEGRALFFRKGAGWWPRPDFSARTWAAVAIGALTASGPAYYAFFGCYLFLVAGGYGWSRTGSARPLLSGAALAALTVGVGVVNALPAIAYEQRYGANPEAKWRAPEEAETYGLKVVQMILPVDDHRAPALARLKAAYNSTYRPLQNENETATLGLVGAAGFLALLGIALFRVRTRAPLPGALAALTLAAVLLGTIGGLGSAFNFLVYPQIRAYNRISVYIAFFSLLGLLWLLEAALHYRPHPRLGKGRVGAVVARLGAWVLFPGLMLLGLWDQVTWRPSSPATAGQEAQARERFEHDRAFVRRIEAALPRGAMVFQLPYAHYPEHTGQHRMGHYAHLRLYLHSASLRWSFGAMRGREVDQWQQRVASQPPEEMLKALVLAGFGGLTIDRRGYADSASGLEAEVRRLLGAEPVVSPDGERAFYPLGEFARRLRAEYSPEEWERQREAACEPLCLLWQEGFFRLDDPAKADPYRVGRKHSRLTVVNPSGRPRRARLRMVLGARDADRAELRISGALFGERVALTRAPELLEKELVVPPGRHAVFFDCEPSADYRPWDSRRGVFFVGSCTLEEPGGRETALPRAEQADSPGDR